MTYIVRTLIDGLVFDHNTADVEEFDVAVQLLRGEMIIREATLQA